MGYLVYLKRSFTRRPGEHARLWVILTCALILPLLVSILIDSGEYGMRLYRLETSRGETFHILNASEGDLALFENIPGLSRPRYEDGVIYLRIMSDDEWRDADAVNGYGESLSKRFPEDSGLLVTAYDYDFAHGVSGDGAELSQRRALLALNAFLMALSALTVRSAYANHLARFDDDVAALVACGARRRQIRRIFESEFAILFVLSAAGALAVSAGAMRLLFRLFLEIRGVPGLAWLVFHMDIGSTALHILAFLAAMGAAFLSALRRYGRPAPQIKCPPHVSLVEKAHQGFFDSLKRRPEATLARLWIRRANAAYRGCLAVSVPVTAVFLFIFGCLTLNVADLGATPEYQLRLTSGRDAGGFTEGELELIRGVEGVAEAIAVSTEGPDVYVLPPRDSQAPFMEVRLIPMSGLAGCEAEASANIAAAGWGVGDEVTLFSGAVWAPRTLKLTVTALREGGGDGAVEIYVSDSLYSGIMGTIPLDAVDIKLADPGANSAAEAYLRRLFPGEGYEIINYQARADFVREASAGVYVLLAVLFAVVFLFVQVLLGTKIRDYISSSRSVIRSLYTLGASAGVLRGSYMRQASRAALLAAALPGALCAPALALAASSAGLEISGAYPTVPAALASAACAGLIYLAPVRGSLGKILHEMR